MRAEIERALAAHAETRGGFPRVDWAAFTRACPVGWRESDEAKAVIAECWAALLFRTRPGAVIESSAQFVGVSWCPSAQARPILRAAEDVVGEITRYLRGIARRFDGRKLVVLLLPSLDDLIDFVADSYPEEGEFGTMAAVYCRPGSALSAPHIAVDVDTAAGMPAERGEDCERIMAHELTHACLAHLDLPLWLDEGFATVMEQTVFGIGNTLTPEQIGEQRAFWTPARLQGFWSGEAFFEAASQGPSYELAEFLLRSLSSDYDRLVAFAHQADIADGGVAACRVVYGRELGSMLRGILGPGDWQPRPETWPEDRDELSAYGHAAT